MSSGNIHARSVHAVSIQSVNIHDAKTHFSKLVERAEAGEEIVIARAGKPVAKLVPLGRRREPRQLGIWTGKVWISPDFDDDEELIALFEEGEVFPREEEL